MCNWEMTVDRVLVCPVESHPKCVAVGTCPGSCQGIHPYEHGLHDGPGDFLGYPVHYRQIVQFCGMTCNVAVVIDWEGALRCFLNLSQMFIPVSPMYSSVHSGWSHLYLYII